MPTALLTPNAEADPLEILDPSVDGFTLSREGNDDLFGLFTQFEDEWASSPDSEGAFPVRSKPNNIERPGRVLILGDDEPDLEAKVLLWQQTIMAIRRNGGTLVYTTRTGEQITFEIYKASVLEVGQNPHYRLGGTAESTFVLTCAPYALLPSSTVNITAEIGTQTNATTVSSPSLLNKGLLTFLTPNPGGSAPARVKFTVSEDSGQNRMHLEGGVDPNYDSSYPAPLRVNAGWPITVTTSAAADDIIDTTNSHALVAGDRVRFTSLTGGTGLSVGTVYYVISANLAAQTFQVSTTSGGSAVNFTSDITAGTVVPLHEFVPLAGTQTTRVGNWFGVLRATLTETPVAICKSGAQPHIGGYRHRVRCYGSGTGPIWVRLAWKANSSPQWRENDWVMLTGLSAWYELDLGLMQIHEAAQGDQTCEWRVEAYSETVGDTFDVDFDFLIPASPHFKARVSPEDATDSTPTEFSAFSNFTTESGAITGDSLLIGGTWAGSGDADDFTVAGGVATRTAVSDSAGIQNGRLIRAGSTSLAHTIAELDYRISAAGGRSGLILRWTDASNFLAVYHAQLLVIAKRVAGVTTTIASKAAPSVIDVEVGLRAEVDATGRVTTVMEAEGTSGVATYSAEVTDDDLATGGALDDGLVGIIDSHESASASTRTYRRFAAWSPTVEYVLNADGETEIRSDQILRESTAGEWGRIDSTGGYPTLLPGRQSRVALKVYRNDIDLMPSNSILDEVSVTCEITPRVSIL